MMNMGNLGSKESVGVIFKEDICVELCLNHWFESDWYFCNIAQSRWFWKSLSRKKVLNQHFLKSLHVTSHTQMFFKIGVLRNIAIFTEKHLCWSLFLIKLQALRAATLFKTDFSTGVFLWILRNFYEQLFLKNTSVGYFRQFKKITVQWTYADLLFLLKNIMWDGFY